MRYAINPKIPTCPLLAAVLLLFASTATLRAGDDQDKAQRGNPAAGARGGATHTAPAPKIQQQQPPPAAKAVTPQNAPAPSAPRTAPKRIPRTERAPAPIIQNVPQSAPTSPSVKAPRVERAPRDVPSAGAAPQERPKIGRPQVTPGAGTVTRSPNVGNAPPAIPQTARELPKSRGATPRVMTERHVPQGNVTRQKDGSYSVRTRAGNEYSMRPNGSVRAFQSQHGEAQFRADGTVRTVRARDITVVHRPVGRSVMLRERPDHVVIASYGAGQGYIQRPFAARGHDFVQRTYYSEHGHFSRFYRPYRYHGFGLYAYVPVLYYPPLFYRWIYAPWTFGVYFHWGWLGASWYPYYGPYFTPYPVYMGAPFWLTDYLLAAELEQDYRDRMAAASDEAGAFAPPCGAGQVRLSSEVKQAVADEVRWQLAEASRESQAVATSGMPDIGYGDLDAVLSDNKTHVFVVSSGIDVSAGIGDCVLTPGDVLQTTGSPPRDAQVAYLRVLASKSGGCARGSVVAVPFQDLQEMLNRMRETVDQGLADLRSRQGQGGLPVAPAEALRGDVNAPFAAAAPPPDPNGAALLNQMEREGSAAEQEVLDQAFEEQRTYPPAAAGTIQLGQTVEQVTARLGPPNVVVDLAGKKMYVYPNLKITFTAGRVTDVQ